VKRDASDKAFDAFLSGLPAPPEDAVSLAPRETDDALVHELVVACLSWNAPRAGVADALARLREIVVDYNELRVMLPDEAAGLITPKDPLGEARFSRMRSALNEIFQRENGITLAHLREENKRDAKAYLESLPGLPAYAANRVALVGCAVHVFPVDGVLLSLFDAAGVIEEGTDEAQLAARCERSLRAGEALGSFQALEVLALKPPKRTVKKKTTRKATGKSTAKKKAASKKTTKKRSRKTA